MDFAQKVFHEPMITSRWVVKSEETIILYDDGSSISSKTCYHLYYWEEESLGESYADFRAIVYKLPDDVYPVGQPRRNAIKVILISLF